VAHDEFTERAISAAIEVHRHLGPGLLETAYRRCLAIELRLRGSIVIEELVVPLTFKGHRLDAAYRIDLLVNDDLIIEVKSVRRHEPVFEAQLLTYLRLLDKKRGLLLNFGLPMLKHGIKRFSR
jgi:GxxExxY protein